MHGSTNVASRTIDDRHRAGGLRVRMFAQPPWVPGYENPVTAWLSPRPGSVGAGPSDSRIRVLDADKSPFAGPFRATYSGPLRPPAQPHGDGHFDHIGVDHETFIQVHAYTCVRRVLDIWEHYHGRPIPWPVTGWRPLAVYPQIDWSNAQFGPGFIEAGAKADKKGNLRAFALSFDVMAHETGHAISFALGGLPRTPRILAEFVGFHEAIADVIAMISSMHFQRVVTKALNNCRGNIYRESVLSRIGELSRTDEIRLLIDDSAHDPAAWAGKTVDDVPSKELHEMGATLSGALLDITAYFYVTALARFGVLDDHACRLTDLVGADAEERAALVAAVEPRYAVEPEVFQLALQEARDRMGVLLVGLLRRVNPDRMTLVHAGTMLAAASRARPFRALSGEIISICRQRGLLDE